ncbi:hypothetical protein FHS83_003488 [Rhizomicrobium palustre]|uniref:DUF721 domain-containing protein n=1 Tax=Rhizomicrobium palustre TaxID=189966 RepID=A0A846N577_9PROT|nr:DciA family protein [Rhizomicrobium palustre]NIK90170.1 hypothetical protein [Rhizomicrobium palustre]
MAAKKPPPPDAPPERRGRAGQIAPDIMAIAGSAFAQKGFTDPALVLQWEKIAGPETARICRPLRFSQGPQGGVLTLLAEPAAALFLQHETRTLCARINTYFGHPLVARLRFVQGALAHRPPPPKPIRPAAEMAQDDPARQFEGREDVREALWRLARARHNQRG